ncbi:GRB2-associated-binding protein 3 isoform X2 [Xenopus tropicalis]|uniref:GRB2-associated-binding protein 3 isoform X2 n=1 Tax=Xenopus tropicalis TaxID=8364 RepID=A0A8J1IQA3_XENTR|nr:GRB2-associated-binding protein 3 isoform X2 [Xenopus tropicalis]
MDGSRRLEPGTDEPKDRRRGRKQKIWRRRWFVLRRGRMSGNPDVLEYYRNKNSKKPIRVIDLNDCEVQKYIGVNLIKKEFENSFVFIVKTIQRTFYLVARTEEEMQSWVNNITQICNFGQLEDGTDSVESLSHTNSSVQASPAVSTHTSRITDPSFSVDSASADITSEENRSESESIFIPDYLFLSNCESGKLNSARCDAWSNSEKSLEQTSTDDVFLDSVQSQHSHNQTLFGVNPNHNNMPPASLIMVKDLDSNGSSSDFSSSSPLLGPSVPQTFSVDYTIISDGEVLPITPPPRPPKPNHFSEGRPEVISIGNLQNGHFFPGMVPRRISLSSLDNVRNWRGELEDWSLRTRDKRLSLNLPRFAPLYSLTSESSEDSYVPMNPNASPPASESDCSTDGYIPMSPVTAAFPFQSPVNSKVSSPLPELPTDLEPPPVNRDLKPRRKMRPPPLDLRNLSTIREHAPLTRMWTVPYNRTSFTSPESDCINSAGIFSGSGFGEDVTYIQMEHRQGTSPVNGSFPWPRKFNLDYLALDFNSASPSPVQKKPFLSEEQRVDYVQVDEKKTQALQNTKQEWTDERQSKV